MPQEKKQPSRDFPLAPTPKPTRVSVSVLKEKADSLNRESWDKKDFAKVQELFAKAQIKNDGGNTSTFVPHPFGEPEYGPTGYERMNIVQKIRESAKQDSIQAERYKNMIKKKK